MRGRRPRSGIIPDNGITVIATDSVLMGVSCRGLARCGATEKQGRLLMRKVVGMETFDALLSVWMLLAACGLLFSASR
jgi:hypothetical protein